MSSALLACILVGAVATLAGAWLAMPSMRGPEFLVFYVVVLALMLVGSYIARRAWFDSYGVSAAACVLFEGIGVERYISGTLAGMHRFGFMFGLMLLGGLLFFVRAKDSGGFGIVGACGGGGCGGGGACGGGGCGGGCGGCGGG